MGFATQIPPCKGVPLTPSGLRPEPQQRSVAPLQTPLSLAARQEGKALVFSLHGVSVLGVSRVKVKPLRGRLTANLDTSSQQKAPQ